MRNKREGLIGICAIFLLLLIATCIMGVTGNRLEERDEVRTNSSSDSSKGFCEMTDTQSDTMSRYQTNQVAETQVQNNDDYDMSVNEESVESINLDYSESVSQENSDAVEEDRADEVEESYEIEVSSTEYASSEPTIKDEPILGEIQYYETDLTSELIYEGSLGESFQDEDMLVDGWD